MAEVIDLFTSHTIWTALEFTFSHISRTTFRAAAMSGATEWRLRWGP